MPIVHGTYSMSGTTTAAEMCRKRGDRSPLAPWLNLLPRDFGTPLHYRSTKWQSNPAQLDRDMCGPPCNAADRLRGLTPSTVHLISCLAWELACVLLRACLVSANLVTAAMRSCGSYRAQHCMQPPGRSDSMNGHTAPALQSALSLSCCSASAGEITNVPFEACRSNDRVDFQRAYGAVHCPSFAG